jgi:hypothetical protein
MTHDLKILPQYFCRVKDGSKTFEVRENDRGYQPGDIVKLMEWDNSIIIEVDRVGSIVEVDRVGSVAFRRPLGYTGKNLSFRVGYVYPIDEKRVVFSLLSLEEE